MQVREGNIPGKLGANPWGLDAIESFDQARDMRIEEFEQVFRVDFQSFQCGVVEIQNPGSETRMLIEQGGMGVAKGMASPQALMAAEQLVEPAAVLDEASGIHPFEGHHHAPPMASYTGGNVLDCEAAALMICDSDLRSLFGQRLGRFDARQHLVDERLHAAVTLTVVQQGFGADLEGLPVHDAWRCEAALILTRRAKHMRRHAGQWALPGGRLDPGETPEESALRELEEEVGLALGPDAILGRLDDFTTRSGFVMTPVVVWGGAARELTANPEEVASIHRIPLLELLRPDAPRLEVQEGSDHPVLRMPIGEGAIAAPTAALLYQFREVLLRERDTRVDHFEQPHFAWS